MLPCMPVFPPCGQQPQFCEELCWAQQLDVRPSFPSAATDNRTAAGLPRRRPAAQQPSSLLHHLRILSVEVVCERGPSGHGRAHDCGAVRGGGPTGRSTVGCDSRGVLASISSLADKISFGWCGYCWRSRMHRVLRQSLQFDPLYGDSRTVLMAEEGVPYVGPGHARVPGWSVREQLVSSTYRSHIPMIWHLPSPLCRGRYCLGQLNARMLHVQSPSGMCVGCGEGAALLVEKGCRNWGCGMDMALKCCPMPYVRQGLARPRPWVVEGPGITTPCLIGWTSAEGSAEQYSSGPCLSPLYFCCPLSNNPRTRVIPFRCMAVAANLRANLIDAAFGIAVWRTSDAAEQ